METGGGADYDEAVKGQRGFGWACRDLAVMEGEDCGETLAWCWEEERAVLADGAVAGEVGAGEGDLVGASEESSSFRLACPYMEDTEKMSVLNVFQ